MQARTPRFAGWLPPVRVGDGSGTCGWLPLKATSVAAVYDALTNPDRQFGVGLTSSSTAVRGGERLGRDHGTQNSALARAMLIDPALVICSAAFASTAKNLNELAQWWWLEGSSRWDQADWLAAPDESVSSSVFPHFEKLDDYFRTVPLRHWLSESDPWFEVAGVSNPIANTIKMQWRDAHHDVDRIPSPVDAHLAIARAVRRIDHNLARSQEFSVATESIRRGLAHRLAYGLSHEINNPLANISTRAQTLAAQVAESHVRESLQRIVDQTSRAHAMIADLMFYANPPEMRACRFDLVERLEMVLGSLAATAARLDIDVRLNGAEVGSEATQGCNQKSPWMMVGDAEMIGEAVAVLIRNSIEAIGTEGLVEVGVWDADGAVQIIVADSGPGMTAA